MIVLALLLLLGAQDPDVEEAVRNLSDPDPEMREQAARRLKSFGSRSLPGLKKAAEGADAEHAARCRRLFKVISFEQTLSPELVRAMPSIGERLAFGTDADWTVAFLALADDKMYRGVHPLARAQLVPRAIRGAFPSQLFEFYEYIKKWDVREAVPALVDLVDERNRPSFDVVLNEPYDLLLAMNAREAGPAIIRKLEDPGTRHLSRYVDLAAYLRLRETIPALGKRLESAEPWDRWSIVRALGFLGDPSAALALRKARGDKIEEIRWESAVALVRLGDPEGLKAFREYMKVFPGRELPKEESLLGLGESGTSVLHVLELLQERRVRDLAPGIVALCSHPDEEVALRAKKALCFQQAGGTEDEIAKLLKEEDVVEAAVEALCSMRATGYAADVVRVLPDLSRSDVDHERQAARLLTRDNWKAFRSRLDDEAPHPLVYAIRMADLGIAEAVPVLIGSPWDWEETPEIHEALRKLDRKTVIAALKNLLGHREEHLRGRAVEALAALSSKEALDDIRKLRGDTDPYVRMEVLLALLSLGERREALAFLESLAPKRISDIPLDGLGTLARAGGEKALEGLKRRAGSNNPRALSLYATIAGKKALPFLRELKKERNWDSRVAVLVERARLGDTDAVAGIVPLLERFGFEAESALDDFVRFGLTEELEKARDGRYQKPGEQFAGLLLAARAPDDRWTWIARNHLGSRDGAYRRAAAHVLIRADALSPKEVERLLQDPDASVREDVSRWVSEENRERALRIFKDLLRNPSSRVRVHAAQALALMGDASGTDELLGPEADRNEIPLFVLNAVRRPEQWKRLERSVGLTLGRWPRKVAASTGLALDVPSELSFLLREQTWVGRWRDPHPFTAREVLDYALPRRRLASPPLRTSFILETDRIRVVRREDAVAFWKRWNAERER